MKENPKASVLLPVYNGLPYLDQALESVFRQTMPYFEVLLLNDGSTDGSPEVLQKYAARDARCRLIDRENRGLIRTLNEGVEIARSDIIIRMDADDICTEDRFEKQIDYLSRHPDCVAVGGNVRLIDPDGDIIISKFIQDFSHDQIDAQNLRGTGSAICHPASAMRRSSVIAAGGYRDEYVHAEDIDLFLRLAERGQLVNIEDVVLDYRQHPQAIGYTKRAEQIASAHSAAQDARARRGLSLTPDGCFENIESDASAQLITERWAWWALDDGNSRTAKKYALRTMLNKPFNLSSFKLLVCALRGY